MERSGIERYISVISFRRAALEREGMECRTRRTSASVRRETVASELHSISNEISALGSSDSLAAVMRNASPTYGLQEHMLRIEGQYTLLEARNVSLDEIDCELAEVDESLRRLTNCIAALQLKERTYSKSVKLHAMRHMQKLERRNDDEVGELHGQASHQSSGIFS